MPGPPHIRPTFGADMKGRSARAFEARSKASVGSVFCDRSVTELTVRTYEMDIGQLAVDALTMLLPGGRPEINTHG